MPNNTMLRPQHCQIKCLT